MYPNILMMSMILLVLVVLLVVFLFFNKGKSQKLDYKTFFIMGVVWLIFGIYTSNFPLTSVGLVLTILGTVHRDKWENLKTWNELSKKSKIVKSILLVVLTALFIAGIVIYKTV